MNITAKDGLIPSFLLKTSGFEQGLWGLENRLILWYNKDSVEIKGSYLWLEFQVQQS